MKVHPLTKVAIGLTATGAAYVLVHKKIATHEAAIPAEIHGFVSPGYESVREAFVANSRAGMRSARRAACFTKAKRSSIFGVACGTS